MMNQDFITRDNILVETVSGAEDKRDFVFTLNISDYPFIRTKKVTRLGRLGIMFLNLYASCDGEAYVE